MIFLRGVCFWGFGTFGMWGFGGVCDFGFWGELRRVCWPFLLPLKGSFFMFVLECCMLLIL